MLHLCVCVGVCVIERAGVCVCVGVFISVMVEKCCCFEEGTIPLATEDAGNITV